MINALTKNLDDSQKQCQELLTTGMLTCQFYRNTASPMFVFFPSVMIFNINRVPFFLD